MDNDSVVKQDKFEVEGGLDISGSICDFETGNFWVSIFCCIGCCNGICIDGFATMLETALQIDDGFETTGWIILQVGKAICPVGIIIGTPWIGATVPVTADEKELFL